MNLFPCTGPEDTDMVTELCKLGFREELLIWVANKSKLRDGIERTSKNDSAFC